MNQETFQFNDLIVGKWYCAVVIDDFGATIEGEFFQYLGEDTAEIDSNDSNANEIGVVPYADFYTYL